MIILSDTTKVESDEISAMGGDGDGFGGVAEGGDDALFLGGEAGEEVAEDELEGIVALRATAEVGEGVGDGGAVAAADLPGGPGEEQGVAAGLRDETEAVGLGGGVEGGVLSWAMPARVWRAAVWSNCWSLSRLPVAMTRGRLVRRALQVRGRWPRKAKRLRWSASLAI
ncbi:MAG: hypothetical protein JNK37_15845 [Verrucomicrobiales bacterium]|nr:hypothetical protein [Verrucomicrobiales bacterium]